MTTHEVTPTVIPTPLDFPVVWADPSDVNLTLRRDKQHTPMPITPLTGWVHENYWAKGISSGWWAMRVPRNMLVRRINTYSYLGSDPLAPPEGTPEAWALADQCVTASIPTFGRRWDDEWLPEIKEYYSRWDAFDLPGATLDDLLVHLDWTLTTFVRLWHIHMELAPSRQAGPNRFHDLYMDLFGGETLDCFKLLQGIDNESIAADMALWTLSRLVKSDHGLTSLFGETETGQVMDALSGTEAGIEFSIKFQAYLNMYGKRSDTVVELADPSWVEEPTTAIELLKNYLSDSAVDPDIHWREMTAEREKLVAEARENIAGYPDAVKGQFEMLLAGGQQGHRIQEDHNWWLDQQGLHRLRRVFLEVGKRFAAAGVIADSSDIWYLTIDEIRDDSGSGLSGDRRSQIEAEMARWAEIDAPPMVGTDYGPPPDNPVGHAIAKFYGDPPRPPTEDNPDVFGGTPGSPGKVRATARVIIKLADAGKLNEGEILVTATTSPPWTPLFATAGGIVTDTGGALSHCAIVAREYDIPAVVGTGVATSVPTTDRLWRSTAIPGKCG